MTWFIIEYDSSKIGDKLSIVGVDEFRNDAYLSELNHNKSNTVSYDMVESINPCKGYNDGTYYLTSDRIIHWKSCEVSIPKIPPETFEVGSLANPYVFVVSSNNPAVIDLIRNNFGITGVMDEILRKLGYETIFVGVGDNNEFQLAFIKKGTEPISITLLILIGIIALTVVFVAYQVRFSIRAYMDGKVLIDREDTAQAWIDGNKAVLESPFTSDEDKQQAADNLTNPSLPETPSEQPIPESPSGSAGGFLGGAGTGALLALAAVYLLSKKK